ncbi:MAG: hypothetical protein K2Y18_07770 [Alphaproteobacteria bacterium]|jgi:hypothetical protein|nr:hypothetical protein [Alphaproteobacteria bacterium]
MKLTKLVLPLLTAAILSDCALSVDFSNLSPAPRHDDEILGAPTKTEQPDDKPTTPVRALSFTPTKSRNNGATGSQAQLRSRSLQFFPDEVQNARKTNTNDDTKLIVESVYAKKAKACWSGFEATRAGQKIIPVLVFGKEWVATPAVDYALRPVWHLVTNITYFPTWCQNLKATPTKITN